MPGTDDVVRRRFFRILDEHIASLRKEPPSDDPETESARQKLIEALSDPERREKLWEWFLESEVPRPSRKLP